MKTLRIGRHTDNDIVIVDDSNISRYHCQITQDDTGNYIIVDRGSSNGTFVNGNKITNPVFITDHDVIRIGNSVLPWRSYFQEDIPHPSEQETTINTLPPASPISPSEGIVVNVNQVISPPSTPTPNPMPTPPLSPVIAYAPVSIPPKEKGCGFGVAAFILGLVGFSLLAIIFAIVSLGRGERNKGFAITGLIFGIIWAIIAFIIVLGL